MNENLGNDTKDLAYKDYLSGMKYKDIAEKYGVSLNTVKSWKKRYGWDRKGVHTKKSKGAPKNNKNAVGYGAPKNNKNAETHGLFSKYLPDDTKELMEGIKKIDPLDILWQNITIQYAAIIRSQKIMHVENKDEMIKVLKKKTRGEKSDSDEWEFQFAWDRQAVFLNAQSRAMGELRSLIKQYDEMLHKNWELATEEQKARIVALKAKVDNTEDEEVEDDGFIDALKGKVGEIWAD